MHSQGQLELKDENSGGQPHPKGQKGREQKDDYGRDKETPSNTEIYT